MSLFTDDDLQGFADFYQDLAFNQDFQLKRNSTQDSDYGSKDTPVVIAEGKGMRKKPSPALLQLYASRIGAENTWHVVLPKGQDVLEGDIVAMDGDDMEVQILLKESWAVSCDVLASVTK